MEDKKELRFSGKLGTEYELFTKAYPHYLDFQGAVTKSVQKDENESFTALEVGTGPGETTEIFANHFKNAEIICVDNETEMIKQAKTNLKHFGERIKIKISDALKFIKSLDSDSIDVFFSGFTLHNFNKSFRKEFLIEIFRVLKSGGQFVNGDKYALDDLKERHKAFNWSIQRYLDIYPQNDRDDLCYDWIVHMGEDENPKKLMIESESIGEMESIGFNNIKITFREKTEAVLFARK
jgi:ubiquinone/menaquinone biosynthesis C-methylase UbiE